MLAVLIATALQGANPAPARQVEVVTHPVFVGAILPPDIAAVGTQAVVPSEQGDHDSDVVCKVVVPGNTRFRQLDCDRRYRWRLLTSESIAYLKKIQDHSKDYNVP